MAVKPRLKEGDQKPSPERTPNCGGFKNHTLI